LLFLIGEAIVVVPMISMAYLLYGIYVNHSIWYKLNDLTIYAVYITLIGAIVTVLINVIFVPSFGYMASAWAHVASYLSMIVASFAMAEKRYKVGYNKKQYIPYFLISISMVIFARFLIIHQFMPN
jgi:O-antigen/teichoic acid export membrane protein